MGKMKVYVRIILALLLASFVPVSAGEALAVEEVPASAELLMAVELWAGGGNVEGATNVGYVNVYLDGETLYLEYHINEQYKMTETHVQVVNNVNEIPHTKKGNPVPGKFEYSATFDPGVTHYVMKITGEEIIPGQTIIALHGALDNGETFWAGELGVNTFNEAFGAKRWGMYFVLPEAPEEEEGLIVDLWAGQTIDVGYIEVSDDGEYLYIEYHVNESWSMVETQIELANDPSEIPMNGAGNPKPGQFDVIIELNETGSYEVVQGDAEIVDTYVGENGETVVVIKIPYNGEDIIAVHGTVVDENGNSETFWAGNLDENWNPMDGTHEFPGNRWGWYFEYKTDDS